MAERTPVIDRTAGEQEKLADTAYRSVLAKILSHELSGGAVIQERKLAEQMGISRTPLRDALKRLEGEGLLVRLTDRLITVRVITLQDYLHTLDVRAMIEPHAAAAAVRSIGERDLERLRQKLNVLAAHQGNDLDKLHWEFDDALHETIAEHSGNPFLARTIAEMRRYTKIFERQMIPLRTKPGIDDHRRILDAFGLGRADKVREAMADHIRNVRKRALDGL
jgi:DNA-binding GntR family transcriptional regulator